MTKPTFVIGDCHGHHDRLHSLLLKAGIIDAAGNRIGDFEVVQLGDLGQYDLDSRSTDAETWRLSRFWLDTVLWGNHDRAIVDDARHTFRGYRHPLAITRSYMLDRLPVLAYAAHGYLLTHAGLAPRLLPLTESLPVEGLVRLISVMADEPVVNAISQFRGGNDPVGGILWRDDREPLLDIPQIFGHTRGSVRKHGRSYCIDVGSRDNGSLVGIWLPSLQIVAVGPDADIHETPFPEDQ